MAQGANINKKAAGKGAAGGKNAADQSSFSSLSRIASRNSSVLTFVMFSSVDIEARSPVITPSSIVWIDAFSSLSAKSTSASMWSSSPRLHSAPVHAKSVAIELVEVFSPSGACSSGAAQCRAPPRTRRCRRGRRAPRSSSRDCRTRWQPCRSSRRRHSSCRPRCSRLHCG